LQNTIERAVILTDSNKVVEDDALCLPKPALPANQISEREVVTITGTRLSTLYDLEKNHILSALKQAQGKRKDAAKLLDISLRSLETKISKYSSEGLEISL
jgi:transcriptional regulator with PAS, ATPase and Fis domain